MKGVAIVSFPDDNKHFISANNITNLIEVLEDFVRSIFKWFASNQMQVNATKWFLLSRKENN